MSLYRMVGYDAWGYGGLCRKDIEEGVLMFGCMIVMGIDITSTMLTMGV